MMRLNHRQQLPALENPESPEILEGPNGRFAGSECIVPNQVSFTNADDLLTDAGWVTWPGSGSWRRMPDELVSVLFADSFDIAASLSLGQTNYAMSRTLPAGQSEAFGQEMAPQIRTPLHSTLAEEYDVRARLPRPSSETSGAYTFFSEFTFSGDGDSNDSTSETFSFSLYGTSTLRQSQFTYNRDEDLWGMKMDVGATLYWDTNREEPGPTRGQFSQMASSGIANFTLPILGGTYKGRVTGAGFNGEPDNVMGIAMSVEVASFRDLY